MRPARSAWFGSSTWRICLWQRTNNDAVISASRVADRARSASPRKFAPAIRWCEKLLEALRQSRLSLKAGDILIVKHKIVSKAEGQLVELDKIKPSASSRTWARRYKVDARVIELALAQSRRVVRRKRGVLITETRHGLICANSGVDVSNVDGGRHALLLPKDPDASAARLHRELKKRLRAVDSRDHY